MKQNRQDLMDSLEELIKMKIVQEQSNHGDQYESMIKQQKVIVGARLDLLLIEVKHEIAEMMVDVTNLLKED